MNKLFVTIAIAALTTVTLASAATAGSGGGIDSKMASPSDKIAAPASSPQWKPVGGFKVGGGAGGQSTEPGDAFYAPGHPRNDCLIAGGTPKSSVGDDGDVLWLCL